MKNLVADLMYKSLHRIMSDVAMLLMTDANLLMLFLEFLFQKVKKPFHAFLYDV